ncbi:ABC transporter ATP-binding protein [Mesoaciditoga sp.]
MSENVLELSNIVKRFPGTLANDHVNLTLKKGEVHALLGENGAGKSTLMNIIYGIYKADEGEIYVNGEKANITSPHKAIEYGIGMIQQHFSLVPSFSVAENVALGLKEFHLFPRIDVIKKRLRELSKKFGLDVKPESRIWQLSAGEQQRVEILKLLYMNSQIMILDEPTAILTPQEAEGLFKTIKEMVKYGASVIFISHKLKEVLEISDRITVMRHGKVVDTLLREEADEKILARKMVGRDVVLRVEKSPPKTGDLKLSVKNLYSRSDKGPFAVNGLSLEVHKGEILGIAGVAGNGQRELAESIYGLRDYTGEIKIDGMKLKPLDVHSRINHGVAYVPQDRKGVALCGNLPLYYNLFLKIFTSKQGDFNPYLFNPISLKKPAEALVKEYDVATSSLDLSVKYLSGGNMQKIVLARELTLNPELIIAVHPTRGLDVGAMESVYKILIKARENGAAVLLIAGDLEEIFTLSDRVAVLYEGRIVGYSEPDEEHLEEIGLMMAGIKKERVG